MAARVRCQSDQGGSAFSGMGAESEEPGGKADEPDTGDVLDEPGRRRNIHGNRGRG